MNEIFKTIKEVARTLSSTSDIQRSELLLSLAAKLQENAAAIIEANKEDLARMDKDNPLYDRLLLNEDRIRAISEDMRQVATLPCPVGRTLEERTLPNGLHLKKVAVPYGVIGIIYEARPNVTFDVFSLCLKSGNACILKGGKDAENTNRAAVELVKDVLKDNAFNPNIITLLPSTHEAVAELMTADGYVDLVIPRGGRKLIDFVRNSCKVPYIATGAGVVHAYFDKDGDLEMGKAIINNAKTRRVSVCNALDCLLVHREALDRLPELCSPLEKSSVELYCDDESFAALEGRYPDTLLSHASSDSFGTEFLSYRMAVKTVSDVNGAVAHISLFGSGHSECIITDNQEIASMFQRDVDAACVYMNAPTSFTDGAQFGMGAEIGISTQKLGARGPMALPELTTYKWLIEGRGQIRK